MYTLFFAFPFLCRRCSFYFLLFLFLIFHPSSLPFFNRAHARGPFFVSTFFLINSPLWSFFLLLFNSLAYSFTYSSIHSLVRSHRAFIFLCVCVCVFVCVCASLSLSLSLSLFLFLRSLKRTRRYNELFMNGTQKQVESITLEGPGALIHIRDY